MIASLGLAEELAPKLVTLPNGAAVMEYVAGGTPKTFGFGQITEIKLQEALGIHVVGPLPGELAHTTIYAAAVASNTRMLDQAIALVSFMASGEAKEILSASGVI
jgi:ABC-type molybdate transport system substrate-binding protein